MTILIVILLFLLVSARTIAGFVIEFQWWKEMNQLATWLSMLAYRVTPVVAASLIAFAVLLVAHSRALKFASVGRIRNPIYFRIAVFLLKRFEF